MLPGAMPRGSGPRMLELLRCIAAGEREFALTEIAQKTGLAFSTVHRLLDSWVQFDLLERAGPKAYRIGPELFRTASLISQKFALDRLARPILEEIWHTWHETTSFCVLNRSARTATVTESLASPHPLKYVITPHAVISMPWGSLGRAILAHLPADDVAMVLARDRLGPLSGRKLPPRREIDRDLARIRSRGYALFEDRALNIAGVSAPVLQLNKEVIGSLGVTMPASRFSKRVKADLPAAVMEGAGRLGAALGIR